MDQRQAWRIGAMVGFAKPPPYEKCFPPPKPDAKAPTADIAQAMEAIGIRVREG